MPSKPSINLGHLLRQRQVAGECIECKAALIQDILSGRTRETLLLFADA